MMLQTPYWQNGTSTALRVLRHRYAPRWEIIRASFVLLYVPVHGTVREIACHLVQVTM